MIKIKMIHLNIILLISIVISSCSEDITDQGKSVEGKWYLISFECCDLPAEVFSEGEIQWTFQNESVLIDNTIEFVESDQYYFQEGGNYNYERLNSTLNISYNNRSRTYELIFENGLMILSHNLAADGPILKFKR